MFNIYFNLLTYSSTFYICLSDVKKLPEDDLHRIETCRRFYGFYVTIYHFNIQCICWYYLMNCL